MARGWLVVAAVGAALYGGLCAFLWWQQRALLYFPTPPSALPAGSLRTFAVDAGDLRVAVRPRESASAVLYFGGNAEDVAATLPELARTFPDAALFLPHYRGYGGSAGQPSEAALHADALVVFDAVRAEHPAVTVVGRSLGSGVAVRLASERPVERLVLVTPYDSIVDIAARLYWFVPVAWLLQDTFESGRHAPRVTAPTLLVLADDDRVVPGWSSERLLARFAPGVARAVTLAGTDHGSVSAHPRYPALLAGADGGR